MRLQLPGCIIRFCGSEGCTLLVLWQYFHISWCPACQQPVLRLTAVGLLLGGVQQVLSVAQSSKGRGATVPAGLLYPYLVSCTSRFCDNSTAVAALCADAHRSTLSRSPSEVEDAKITLECSHEQGF